MKTVADVGEWLARRGFERWVQVFADNEIDGEVLCELSEADLADLGLPLGPRRKLLKALAAVPEESAAAVVAPTPVGTAERRQLTVMFVDLVGSTTLSARLDPEEMGSVLRAYQNAVAGEIARLEGHVAKFMGDGVLAYFGWPRAHEDEAERAVRAGLAVRDAVARLATGDAPLACRIGVATGLVVVGELIGDGAASEQTVVGDTPNLAARLQALAEPGQVVIALATRRLLGEIFAVAELGSRRMKGIENPVPVFSVTGEGNLTSRFEARGGRLLPMVGRDRELALLLAQWVQARAGEGQGVLLVGEAGHGKSRIVRALVDALLDEPHHSLRWQCSPYHKDSALWPVIQHLRDAAALAEGDSNEVRLDKLDSFIARSPGKSEALPLLAELLGLDGSARYGALELTPQARRAETLHLLVDRLLDLARSRPVLVVLEDAHWIDATTLELIEALLTRLRQAPVLVLLTSRPDNLPALTTRSHVTRLDLGRLDRAGVEAIIHRLGGTQLPASAIDTIVDRTDGVPLFVEELTKAILETDATTIPASLHDSLMTRLDRLPEAKELAQVAACIGREFDHKLLAAIAGRPLVEIDRAMDRLVRAELVFQRGPPANGRFVFKHALVRDAAYESLLRSRRREVHGRIAAAMVENATAGDRSAPQLIARHCLAADDPASAMPHLLRATEIAIAAAAGTEAQDMIRTGLAAVEHLPTDDTTTAWQAKLHLLMGDSLRATLGTAASATAEAYRQSRLAYGMTGDVEGQELALFGEFLSHFNGARLDRADEVAGLLRAAPQLTAIPAQHWHRHEASGLAAFARGRFGAARRYLEALPDALGPYASRPSAGRIYLPWSLFILGFPDSAYERENALFEDLDGITRKFDVAATLGNGCYLPQFGGRLELLLERASRCVEHSQRARLPIWHNIGSVFLGWLAGREGDVERAEALMMPALNGLDAAMHHIEHGYFSSLHADILLRAGRNGPAQSILERALTRHAVTGEHWFDAELHRMLAAAASGEAAAEQHLETALEISREQEARFWELRAARDLARLWAERGERQRALDLLAPVHDWFTEGVGLTDLVEAKALLDALR